MERIGLRAGCRISFVVGFVADDTIDGRLADFVGIVVVVDYQLEFQMLMTFFLSIKMF